MRAPSRCTKGAQSRRYTERPSGLRGLSDARMNHESGSQPVGIPATKSNAINYRRRTKIRARIISSIRTSRCATSRFHWRQASTDVAIGWRTSRSVENGLATSSPRENARGPIGASGMHDVRARSEPREARSGPARSLKTKRAVPGSCDAGGLERIATGNRPCRFSRCAVAGKSGAWRRISMSNYLWKHYTPVAGPRTEHARRQHEQDSDARCSSTKNTNQGCSLPLKSGRDDPRQRACSKGWRRRSHFVFDQVMTDTAVSKTSLCPPDVPRGVRFC